MPYKSHAQRKFFNANRKKLEQSGVAVGEWNQSSKGKKLPMKVQESHSEIRSLAKKAAEYAYERNPKKSQRDKPEEVKEEKSPAHKIVDSDSGLGAIGDILFPNSWGGERAGRTQAMADAIGENTTFNVRHPMTHSAVSAILGSLLGGAVGSRVVPRGMTELGGGLGAAGGTLLGMGLSGLGRNLEMDRINHFYNEDLAAGKVKPKAPNLSVLSAALLPFRGAHRTGQMEAYNAMKGTPIEDQRGIGRDVLNAVGEIAAPVSLLHGYGQNIKTQLAANKANKKEKQDVASLAKAAAIRHSNSDKAEKPELQSGKEEQVVPPVNTTSKSSISPLLTAGILAGGVGLPLGAYLLTQNNKQQASNPQGYKYIHYAADTGWDLGHIARSIREATDRGILNFNDYSHKKLPYVSIDHLGDTFPFGYHNLVRQFRQMVQPAQPFYSDAPSY